MNWYKNMKISMKLISAFIVVALIAAVVGVIGTANLNKMNKDYSTTYDNFGVPLENIGVIGIYFHKNRTLLNAILLEDSDAKINEYINTLEANDTRIASEIEIFDTHSQTDDMKTMVQNLRTYTKDYIAARKQILTHALAGDMENARLALAHEEEMTVLTDGQIRAILTSKNEVGQVRKAAIEEEASQTRTMMISIIILAVIVAVGLGFIISNSISRPIRQIVLGAESIAAGDLDINIELNTKDELGQLSHSFNTMANNLNEVMSNITVASEQVAIGAKQMSESSIVLSRGATEQASSIEELTASLEEITNKINENAVGAQETAIVSNKTKEDAIQGDVDMQDMLKAMDEINASSDSISKIIKVIDEIAFQTNILALNAAVEAARAGQHGKGFAVVAEEVRNLAARSANAAKETADMIEGSINKVNAGMRIANKTAHSLQDIVKAITEINAISISAAENAKEQAYSVTQINQGLVEVSHVVQTNSATSEESAASSEELTSQANMLQQQVARFKLKKESSFYHNMSFEAPTRRNQTTANEYNEQQLAKELDGITLSSKNFGKY